MEKTCVITGLFLGIKHTWSLALVLEGGVVVLGLLLVVSLASTHVGAEPLDTTFSVIVDKSEELIGTVTESLVSNFKLADSVELEL